LAVVARASTRVPKELGLQFAVAGPVDAAVFNPVGFEGARSLKLLGYVNAGELRALYENAAVFVHPSKYEGFGIPPLEAMALGCPVIASNAAAIPEVCGDGAWYFPPDNADTLASLLIALTTEPERRADLIARGSTHVESHSWRGAARCYLEVIEQLLDSPYDAQNPPKRMLMRAAPLG
jgi:glycosyltransferase involved in cell wall biosynthesis